MHALVDYRIILFMESAMQTTTLESTTATVEAAVVFHECQHCGELTEQHPELAGVIAYHDAAECVGGTERFTH